MKASLKKEEKDALASKKKKRKVVKPTKSTQSTVKEKTLSVNDYIKQVTGKARTQSASRDQLEIILTLIATQQIKDGFTGAAATIDQQITAAKLLAQMKIEDRNADNEINIEHDANDANKTILKSIETLKASMSLDDLINFEPNKPVDTSEVKPNGN